jgi:hypothetical protein
VQQRERTNFLQGAAPIRHAAAPFGSEEVGGDEREFGLVRWCRWWTRGEARNILGSGLCDATGVGQGDDAWDRTKGIYVGLLVEWVAL